MNKISLLAFSVAVLLTSQASANSSFQKTCKNITYSLTNNAPTVNAECQRINQSYVSASYVIPAVANINGVLQTDNANNISSFQKTCSNVDIKVDTNNVNLVATCKKIDGSSNNTTYPLSIENIDGKLQTQK